MLKSAARSLLPVFILTVTDQAPYMRRFQIAGKSPRGMRVTLPGQWMKMFVPATSQLKAQGSTYTFCRSDPADRTMELDFVLHGNTGRASEWAGRARVGGTL